MRRSDRDRNLLPILVLKLVGPATLLAGRNIAIKTIATTPAGPLMPEQEN